jgi:cysteine desulfurase
MISPDRLFTDHNASSPLRPAARAAMARALDLGGNPSSVHAEGRAAKRLLEDAREAVAAGLECRSEAIVFTSGATEALHLALDSARVQGFGPVFVSAAEHDSVWASVMLHWPDAQVIPIDADARIDADWLARALRDSGGGSPLVVVQAANNETGAVQPLDRLSTLTRAAGGAVLCDAAQAPGKLPVSHVAGLADWLILSSHKLGGPLGAGALITGPGAQVSNQRPGGGQERGARAGTENVPAIAGFAAAVAEACPDAAVQAWRALTEAERDAYEAALSATGDVTILGAGGPRLANTSCVAFEGWEAARQVMALDLAGAAVSAGAACSSGKVKVSRVLSAAGHAPSVAGCAVRASFGWNTKAGDGRRLADLHRDVARRARARAA